MAYDRNFNSKHKTPLTSKYNVNTSHFAPLNTGERDQRGQTQTKDDDIDLWCLTQ